MPMTAFITRYCKRFSSSLLAVLLLAAHVALAAGIKVEHAELAPTEEAYQLNAGFNIDFSAEVEEAVNKGVVLYFLVEFALMEPRSYWFDDEVTSASQAIRLSYHALSRQYLINVGGHQTTFASLQEAVQALGNIQDWPVVEKALQPALAALVKMREREGAHLARDLADRIRVMRRSDLYRAGAELHIYRIIGNYLNFSVD